MEDHAINNIVPASCHWPAPAKLNLFLHVTGRRPDGYHLLQTVFQILDYGDLLDFAVRSDGRILRKANYAGVDPEQDLVVRAAQALKSVTACKAGVEITVHKKLPMGGGLGGGSSNAATTLVALNQLWSLGLALDELAQIGLKLGADVPVFVRGRTAWAEGVGEILENIETEPCWYVVIMPGCQVPTGRIFNAPDLTRHTPPITIRAFLKGAGNNDCEPVVRQLYPEVATVLDWLGRHGDARLTGTGSCVFAGFETEQKARSVCADVPSKWQAFVARGVNRSPLLDRLEQEQIQSGK